MSLSLPDLSREYVHIDVDGPDSSDVVGVVQVAIVLRGTAVAESDWHNGEWDGTDGQAQLKVRLLVGPGSGFGQLAAGTYNIWARITSSPEQPVIKAGSLRIVATT